MTNYKNIILIVVLILALGFLAFSVGFYFYKRSQTLSPENNGFSSQPQEAGQGSAVIYTADWDEAFGQARAAMDPDKCSVIVDAAVKRDCQDKINLLIAYQDDDINICRAIFGTDIRDTCYMNLGAKLGIDYCSYLSGAQAAESCLGSRLINEVVLSGDISKCDNLIDNLKDKCRYDVIGGFTDIAQCATISNIDFKQFCEQIFE
ncbi:hypothetical protein KJ969_01615 [Patescibacteria group bacterium]|nr:hypothetical protein [Patescibacteria group bacterium]MBU1921965.1 hypothetical protein [Patescibacteria group bacterium]